MLIQDHTTNLLLKKLLPADFDALAERATLVDLARGEGLAVAGDPIDNCWFPLSGIASVIAADKDGKEAEVGIIGCDGMVNSGVLVGSQLSPMRIHIQIAGKALRVSRRAVVAIAKDRDAVFQLFAAYDHALGLQAAFTALAFAQYTLPQRLARWALMCADRVGEERIDLTHETLAIMLSVRRAGVTVALQALTRQNLITPRRGGFSIVDRPGLLKIAGAGYSPSEEAFPA